MTIIQKLKKNKVHLPSGNEMVHSAIYLIAWLFPVIASFLVALSGRLFSYVSPKWQLHNLDIVGLSILTALFGGMSAVIATIYLINFFDLRIKLKTLNKKQFTAQTTLIVVLALVSGFGLYKSFGGSILENAYRGANVTWLGYGAWSVTFIFLVFILISEFLLRRVSTTVLLGVVTVLFFPFLISGSRIDYFSVMLGLAAYKYFYSDGRIFSRIIQASSIIALALFVSNLIGNIRYQVTINSALNFHYFRDISLPINESIIEKSPASLENKTVNSGFYLSTLGDIGASHFQIVGLIENGEFQPPDAGEQIKAYFERLLPGTFFANRPVDVATLAPENIGGGALHALGEGYAINRLFGCGLMGAVFGSLIAFSIYLGRSLVVEYSPVLASLVLFPWLILVRGGWYQFFALIKTLEIIIFILILLMLLRRFCR